METSNPHLRTLIHTNFIDGTLVEYLRGSIIHVEFGRATIQEVIIDDIEFCVKTDGPVFLELYDLQAIKSIQEKDRVFYVCIPQLANYALAPKGVEIPSKPDYDEYVTLS